MISLVSIVILSLSLLYFDLNRDPPNTIEKFGGEVFTGLGVFATGFVCHQIITPTLFSLPVRHAAVIIEILLPVLPLTTLSKVKFKIQILN